MHALMKEGRDLLRSDEDKKKRRSAVDLWAMEVIVERAFGSGSTRLDVMGYKSSAGALRHPDDCIRSLEGGLDWEASYDQT